MRRLVLFLVIACGCASKSDGPTPTLLGIQPDPICDAQKMITLTITGSGFSPAVDNGLTSSPTVVMPRVVLTDTSGQTIDIPPEDVSLPDTTGTALTLAVPQSLVPPGTYDVTVINPDGNQATTTGGLTVDPPPALISVSPTVGNTGQTVTVTLTGTGFRQTMTVTLDAMPPVTGTVVSVSADGTMATVTFDLTGVAAGIYPITVDNQDGCTSTLANAFTVRSLEFTIMGVDPPFGCMCDTTTNVTITSAASFVSTPTAYMTLQGVGTRFDLKRVAFVDANTITAAVPTGTMPLGTYDLTVVNPPTDGRTGTLVGAFRVVPDPIPVIDDVVPDRGPPNTSVNLTIYGKNFRSTVTVQLLDRNGMVVKTATGGTVSGGGTQIAVAITTPTTEDAYLVRVIDDDEMTYSTWSAFIVGAEGASGNLHTFAPLSMLNTGRRMLAGASARDDLGNTFVYAIAGDTGGATPSVLGSIEVAQLSKFGALGAWHQEKTSNELIVKRDAPAAATVELPDPADPCTGFGILCLPPLKTYVYVVGGRSDAGTVLGSVERAMVLRNADAPVVADPTPATGGTLAAGTWYYKVSAICSATDLDNKSGETLPSDEAIAVLDSTHSAVTLAWSAVATTECTAVGYKIYRTKAADGTSQTEVLTKVLGNVLTYTDLGDMPGTEVPLPPGALGVWSTEAITLSTGRWGHQGATIADANNSGGGSGRSLYVLGGKSDATTGYLASVEYAGIDTNGHLIGTTFTTGATTTNMTNPLAFFSLVVETPQNVSGYTGLPRLLTLGGVGAGMANATSNEILESTIASGGGNGAWAPGFTNMATPGTLLNGVGGNMAVIASNKLWSVGGARMFSNTTQAFSNVTSGGDDVAFDASGDLVSPTQSAASVLTSPRTLGAVITGSGFIYFVGGSSDGTDATTTTYQTF
ncbi:MAG: IPT/TIG domain-containing protein [Acidobacteriota bacterium]